MSCGILGWLGDLTSSNRRERRFSGPIPLNEVQPMVNECFALLTTMQDLHAAFGL